MKGKDAQDGERNDVYQSHLSLHAAGARGAGRVKLPPGVIQMDPCIRIDHDVSRNVEFLDSMSLDEARRYMGEWIAVAGGGIVAHGKDPRRVHSEAYAAGKGEPYMQYIYAKPEEVPFLYIPSKCSHHASGMEAL